MKCILELQTVIHTLANTDDILNVEEITFFTAITPILSNILEPLELTLHKTNFINLKLEKEMIKTGKKIVLKKAEDNTHYILIPFFMHKIPFVIYTITGKKKNLKEQLDFITSIYDYIEKEFYLFRKTKKKAIHAQKITEKNLVKKLQSFLQTRETAKPWYLQTHYPLPFEDIVATDFANLYTTDKDTYISLLCDITAQKKNRYACFVQTNAWFEMLSHMDVSLKNILKIVNNSIYEQQGEWYLSAICTRYTASESTLEIFGAGTCNAFLYQHDTGKLKSFCFELPLGQKAQQTIETKTVKISSGDVFFACTDGIVNSLKRNEKPLGIDFIKSLILSCHMMSIYSQNTKISDFITENCAEGGIHDDRTIQLIKFP
jgi:hypothetical protein